MRSYLGPSMFLLLGLAYVATARFVATERFMSRLRDDWQRQSVLRSAQRRLQPLNIAVLGGICLVGAGAAVFRGSPSWWLWGLAALTHVLALRTQARSSAWVVATLDGPSAFTANERIQNRRVFAFSAIAAAAFLGCQFVLATGSESPYVVIPAAVLMLIALGAVLAAGWSSVWVFDKPDEPRPRQAPTR